MTSGFAKWENEYNTGDPKIDEQHQQVFVFINQLHQALKLKKDEEEIRNILKGLSDYSVYHFKLEEDQMLTTCYPKYDAHLEEHKIFIDRLLLLTNNMEEKHKSINLRLLKFLKAWFAGHMLNTDKKFVDYLTGNK